MKDWTSEQQRNAMLYGVCSECGTPREAEMISTMNDDGELEVEHRLDPTTCGHMAERFLSSSTPQVH